jgi:hypothetical protein
MFRKKVEPEAVYAISDARVSLTNDQDDRAKKYFFSMSLRLIFFVAAVLVEGPLRWVLFSSSLILPWAAVVIANAGREHRIPQSNPNTFQPRELPR